MIYNTLFTRTHMAALALLLSVTSSAAQSSRALRSEATLDDGWTFSRDGRQWQPVQLPHDWAISGPFDKRWDLQRVAITQNGETEATEKSGRSGALPWIGRGYYQRTLDVPAGYSRAVLVFDGAMAEPRVKVNGREAAYWPYGYNAFRVDITGLLNNGQQLRQQGSRGNKIEVALENVEESSRWYPGAGLYRPVTLELTQDDASIDRWGTYMRTRELTPDVAIIDAATELRGQTAEGLAVEMAVLNPKGHVMDETHQTPDAEGHVTTVLRVEKPEAWTTDSPTLYRLRTRLYRYGQLIDETLTPVGLRTVSVDREHGFRLNGQTVRLRGVCLHHDLGPLGAAVNKAALIRQIKMMKDMGANAIRTAHNMPSQMQMDICDSLGMMVMAETFDMWVYAKCKNGYARFFREWSDRDVENLIRGHRNHPSIVMWSIGNEIPEQGMKGGTDMARHLQDICHRLDPSRPVTQGMDRAENALQTGFAQAMDVPGFNYRVHKYEKNMKQLPQGFLLGSETASTVSSRGVYKFPVKVTDNSQYASWAKNYDPTAIKKADGQCSSYDVEYCSWSNLPDDDWVWQDDKPWVIGEFVWTGYDYLGEPTPYDEYWPSRSSYFGICDLAGLPKDRYYLYRSHWNTEERTVHLLPHWSWGTSKKQKGNRIGKVTPVYCYTDCAEGELFVNGKSQGKISKNPDQRLDRYRLRWNDVKYEPGEVKVVVYDANDRKVGEQTMCTAGKPAKLQLDVWTQHDAPVLNADGEDLAFVTVSLTDKQGTLIPDAADQLTFDVTGAGNFEAVCNGDATSLESFKQPTMKLFHGQLVVVVRSAKHTGTLTLTVKDKQRKLTKKVALSIKN